MLKLAGRWDETQRPREDFMWTFKTLMVNDRGIGTHTINRIHKSLCLHIGPENKNPVALVDPDIDGYRQVIRGLNVFCRLWN